nr:phosphate/phosphite/phosphonate ABC transporter substrate-binding protein [Pseudobdellovibrionaceae bacterium]
MKNVRDLIYMIALVVAFALTGCISDRGELGSEKNPIKFYFTPSQDAKALDDNSKVLKTYLEANTPYKFHMTVPQSYNAVVESFGTKRADVAAINTFGYLTANSKYGVEAKLITVRHGKSTYQSQFLAKANSGIQKIEDLQGKKVAFVDPSSTSGYLLPMKALKEKKIILKDEVYAYKHDAVVSMIYQGQVDAGATFYSPPHEGKMEDARRLVLTQYPDVEEKIKIIHL